MMIALLFSIVSTLQDPAPPDAQDAPVPSVMLEVLNNIRGQPIGPVSVAELDLSEPFLRRFADRVIVSSFEDNFRVIVADEPETKDEHEPKDPPPPASTATTPAGDASSTASSSTAPATGSNSPSSSSNALRIGLGVAGLLLIVWLLALRRRAA